MDGTMRIGMMWLDDDKGISLEEKIRRAADYYRNKYGRSPDLCYVNTRALAEERRVGQIEVLPARNVLPHHFWMGMKNS